MSAFPAMRGALITSCAGCLIAAIYVWIAAGGATVCLIRCEHGDITRAFATDVMVPLMIAGTFFGSAASRNWLPFKIVLGFVGAFFALIATYYGLGFAMLVVMLALLALPLMHTWSLVNCLVGAPWQTIGATGLSLVIVPLLPQILVRYEISEAIAEMPSACLVQWRPTAWRRGPVTDPPRYIASVTDLELGWLVGIRTNRIYAVAPDNNELLIWRFRGRRFEAVETGPKQANRWGESNWVRIADIELDACRRAAAIEPVG